ncbi:MAG: YdiU family protein [Pseudomonadota bacterium]
MSIQANATDPDWNLAFDNHFTRHLPADPEAENQRRQIQGALYSRVQPVQVRQPDVIAYAREVAELLELPDALVNSPAFAQVMSGNQTLPGMDPHATCYGGHQFGNWAGQLGDGRAINLGEVNTANGHMMLQLKGAGPTPYSRTADGLAVLRSSVREFLCSEAMHHLGVPTTRALSLIGTGERVMRDMLYDGHPELEPGAVVCRVSSSFVRFGHFQMLAARQETELLGKFTDYVIEREFAAIAAAHDTPKDRYMHFFREVCERTAHMIVEWMRVGFVHGVMNTDNMSILGETIDYGPYGWLEDFDPEWTPNTTDAQHRRYRYGQQPAIGQWNLMQLANALLPLAEEPAPLEEALSHYAAHYETLWQQMMAAKLGLKAFDANLVDNLHRLLVATETDMTLFYRDLANLDPGAEDSWEKLQSAYYVAPDPNTVKQTRNWLATYQQVLQQQQVDPVQRRNTMNATNPKYVLRNYLAQLAIDDAEKGDFTRINETLDVLRQPYAEQPEKADFAAKRPDWARTRVGCSMLSCSS